MAQLAIAWVLHNDNVAAALVGASRPEQVASNVEAAGVRLTDEVMTRIDEALGDVVVSERRSDRSQRTPSNLSRRPRWRPGTGPGGALGRFPSGEVAGRAAHLGEHSGQLHQFLLVRPTNAKFAAVTASVVAANSSRPDSVSCTRVVRRSLGCGSRRASPSSSSRSTMLVMDVGCSCSRSPISRIGSEPRRENDSSTSAS